MPPEKHSAAVAALLLEVLPNFMLSLRREMRHSRVSSLTMPQFRVLAQLRWGGPTNNKAIAENLGVTVANSSRMIDLLVEKNFVLRVRGVKDKREVVVRLSPKGLEHYQLAETRMKAFVSGIFSSVPAGDLAKMENSLSLIREVIVGSKSSLSPPPKRSLSPAPSLTGHA